MKTTPSTMSPLEAYEALMLFARRRGEGALRLAMHAAVPQGFRPDLLHLLKLNFLPRELHDPGTEADVLFSPLCEEVGRGYFEFGPHVRTLLLDNLAANYAADRMPRIARVANFLLFYVEHAERSAAGGLDRLRRDYLEVQRWVALAFLDPDDAARQLAAALKGTATPGGEVAARLRLGGLASALSSPLVKYRHVLNYAAGLQALEAGDHARARTLLSGLGDEELDVGGVRLRPASDLLRDYSVQSPEPPPTPEKPTAPQPPHAPATKSARLYLCYSHQDRELVLQAHEMLSELGHETWMATMDIRGGEDWQSSIMRAIEGADIFVVFLSQHSVRSEWVAKEIDYALNLNSHRPGGGIIIIPVRLDMCNIPESLAPLNYLQLQPGDDFTRLASEISEALERRDAVDEREGKVRALEALAGRDEPGALEALAEVVREERDARVRLAAVAALGKTGSEGALEHLLVAAGDGDDGVRRAAAKALAAAVNNANAVLIFGFFGTDHVENREVLREELRRRGYVPLVFPFNRPSRANDADVMRAAAPLTRFAVADLTTPPDIQLNLVHYLGTFLQLLGAPVVPLTQRDPGPVAAERLHLLSQRYPKLLPLYSYAGLGELREAFDRIVTEPVAAMLRGARAEPKAQSPFFTEEDIYISYADPDNRPPAEGERGWVDNLRERLKVRLEQLTGGPVKIWDDRNLPLPGHAMGDVLGARLSLTALFVAVVTPLYIRSDRCLMALRNFMGSAAAQAGHLSRGRSRVFKVLKSALPTQEEPEGLRNVLGYQFYEYIEVPGWPREWTQGAMPDRDAQHWRELDDLALGDLASDIKEALDELKQPGRADSSEAL